jgi:nucleotide-binding universal stress UspA family protein
VDGSAHFAKCKNAQELMKRHLFERKLAILLPTDSIIAKGDNGMYRRILLAFDGSASSQRALIDSDAVARLTGARVHLVAVVPEPTAHLAFEAGMLDMPDPVEQRGQAQRRLESGMALLRDHGFEVSGEILFGDPVDQVAEAAERIQAELIVVGHRRNRGWLERWWNSPISAALIERAHCSVLVSIHD